MLEGAPSWKGDLLLGMQREKARGSQAWGKETGGRVHLSWTAGSLLYVAQKDILGTETGLNGGETRSACASFSDKPSEVVEYE